MRRWWLVAIGLVGCGSAQPPAPISNDGVTGQPGSVQRDARDWEPWSADCATKERFVEAADSALEGVIVDCMTGARMPGIPVVALGDAGSAWRSEATSDAAGRYHLQLPEGRYHVTVLLEDGMYEPEPIEIRAHHATVREIRLDLPRCPPASGSPGMAPPAIRNALISAVLDHYAAGGIVDAPPRPPVGPTYVTVKGMRTLALPPPHSRQFVVTTKDDLQREATRSGRDIRFLNILGLEIAGRCATVTIGGDYVSSRSNIGKLCCCSETEVFVKRGGMWTFRMRNIGVCS